MKLLTVLSSEFDDLKRLVVKAWNGKSRSLTAEEIGPFGTDSRPPKGMVALYGKTEVDGDEVIVGYLNKDRLADIGEHRIFSTDEQGALKAWIWLKKNGKILLKGDTNGGLIKIDNLISQTDARDIALKAAIAAGFTALSGLDGGASSSAFNTMIAAMQSLNKTPLENSNVQH